MDMLLQKEGVMMTLATNETKLKIARKRIPGLTQLDVATKANISLMSYQRYESGLRRPNVDTAKSIAEALNSTIEEIF